MERQRNNKGQYASDKNFIERFWNKVKKTNTCWLWIGKRRIYGYGVVKYKNKEYSAHRFVWFLTYGKFPKKLVCHKCDNPPCIRPDHLFEGTHKDNIQDAIKKGRMLVGRVSHRRKLTFQQAEEIRKKYIPKQYGGMQKLIKEYGLSKRSIALILKRETYKK